MNNVETSSKKYGHAVGLLAVCFVVALAGCVKKKPLAATSVSASSPTTMVSAAPKRIVPAGEEKFSAEQEIYHQWSRTLATIEIEYTATRPECPVAKIHQLGIVIAKDVFVTAPISTTLQADGIAAPDGSGSSACSGQSHLAAVRVYFVDPTAGYVTTGTPVPATAVDTTDRLVTLVQAPTDGKVIPVIADLLNPASGDNYQVPGAGYFCELIAPPGANGAGGMVDAYISAVRTGQQLSLPTPPFSPSQPLYVLSAAKASALFAPIVAADTAQLLALQLDQSVVYPSKNNIALPGRYLTQLLGLGRSWTRLPALH